MDLRYLGVILLAALAVMVIILSKTGKSPGRSRSTEKDIVEALESGRKLDAIKHYRFVHDVSLKQAKKAIEDMYDRS